MRQKVAKAIRRSLKYKPKNKREYKTFEIESTRLMTAQFNIETGELKAVRGKGTSFLTECVSGDRKFYQYMKKKYIRPTHEEVLTPLPEEAVMNKIINEAKEEMAKIKEND